MLGGGRTLIVVYFMGFTRGENWGQLWTGTVHDTGRYGSKCSGVPDAPSPYHFGYSQMYTLLPDLHSPCHWPFLIYTLLQTGLLLLYTLHATELFLMYTLRGTGVFLMYTHYSVVDFCCTLSLWLGCSWYTLSTPLYDKHSQVPLAGTLLMSILHTLVFF